MALVFVQVSEDKRKKLQSKLAELWENVANAKAIDPKKAGLQAFGLTLIPAFSVVGIICILSVSMGLGMPMKDLPETAGLILFVTIVLLSAVVALVVGCFTTKKAKKDKDMEIIAQEAILLQEEPLINADILKIDEALNQSATARDAAIAFLPDKYRNIYTLDFLLETVKNLRADTLKEAINLYEAHLSDMELKNQLNQMQMATQMQTEQLEIMNNYMEQINRNQAQMSDDIADIKYTQYIEWLRNS